MLEPLPDLVQKVPARGAISDMVAGRAAFIISRVELANDASVAVPRMPDESPLAEKVSLLLTPEL